MTFELGWYWTILDLGHRTFTTNISNAVKDTTLDSRDQLGNHQWAFDRPYVLWYWMTLNWPTLILSKLHVRYCENGNRYNDCVNGRRTGNHPCALDWHHKLWPWMTLNHPRSRSWTFAANISNMVRDTMLDSKVVREQTISGLSTGKFSTMKFDPESQNNLELC